MSKIYTLSEAARETEVPGIGRNKLYRILKIQGIVDHLNRPEQRYVDAGLLVRPVVDSNTLGWNTRSNVTLVVGDEGLKFVEQTAVEYLKNNPMPKFPHKKSVRYGTDIK